MLLASLLFTSLVTATPDQAVHEVTKGTALYRSCQAEVRLMELPSLAQATQPDLIDGTFCVGFVNGYTGNLTGAGSAICTHGANMGDVVRVYVNFMQQNPQWMEQDRAVGFRLSLQQAYPCPASSAPRLKEHPGADPRSI